MKERPPEAPRRRRTSGSFARITPPQDMSKEAQRALEQAASDQLAQPYLFRLFVTGTTPAAARAVETVRGACEAHLPGRYVLDVIDIYQRPSLARDEQIIATPTLIRTQPIPIRRYVGDLSKVTAGFFGNATGENT